ncbi:MAG: hypothetical protein DME15_02885 [Candidatus Rokuibacteriota bacterium]|nr:MAG: hypothetical protein DME15_02885 [Candidatus Rokubacteria bacterium]
MVEAEQVAVLGEELRDGDLPLARAHLGGGYGGFRLGCRNLVAREPQGARHATVVAFVRAALEKALGRAFHVREEKPIALDERSEPEPDIVVVPGRPRDYLHAHPSRPVLIVEVAGDWKYDSVRLLRRNAVVTPLAAPRARIRVAQILP